MRIGLLATSRLSHKTIPGNGIGRTATRTGCLTQNPIDLGTVWEEGQVCTKQLKRSERLTVEDCVHFEVSACSRSGIFRAAPGSWRYFSADMFGGVAFDIQVLWERSARRLGIVYRQPCRNERIPKYDDTIHVSTTPCRLGGFRYWFHCPRYIDGTPRRRRVGTLYFPPGGDDLGCRICFNLTYESCRRHDKRINDLLRAPPKRTYAGLVKPRLSRQVSRHLCRQYASEAIGQRGN
jgi:hypothetical protein